MDDANKMLTPYSPVELDALVAALRHADLSNDATALKVAKINLLCFFYHSQEATEYLMTRRADNEHETLDNRYIKLLADIAFSLKLENVELHHNAVEELRIGWPQDHLLKTVWCLWDPKASDGVQELQR